MFLYSHDWGTVPMCSVDISNPVTSVSQDSNICIVCTGVCHTDPMLVVSSIKTVVTRNILNVSKEVKVEVRPGLLLPS